MLDSAAMDWAEDVGLRRVAAVGSTPHIEPLAAELIRKASVRKISIRSAGDRFMRDPGDVPVVRDANSGKTQANGTC